MKLKSQNNDNGRTTSRRAILEHYKEEAEKHGSSGLSTIYDMRVRHMEIETVCSYLRDGIKALEIGCGNGFVAEAVVRRFNLDLEAFDFSEDMINLAKKRDFEGAKGHIRIEQADVLGLNREGEYDVIFTVRCIQNLLSWEQQKQALANIARALSPGGYYLMVESFSTGLDNLNKARGELDIEPIKPCWFNVIFDEQETIVHMASNGCTLADEDPFLSGFYFGSRVLLPALTPGGKSVTSKSILNDYFQALPPVGDFCPMKLLCFRKDGS